MAKSSTARRFDEPLAVVAEKRPAFGEGGPPTPPVSSNIPIGSNAWLAVLIFIGAEAMFFAGLIGAYIVFRVSSPIWPPPFQPRLPIAATGVNTLILIASAVTMRRALKAVVAGDRKQLVRLLGATAILGGMFLAVQGFEWIRLIDFGLTVSSSVYGGLFYTLIGFHGLHVLGALIWLLIVFSLAKQGRFSKERHVGLQTCNMYWTFVVGLWPLLYGLVYLL
ncbi:MAG TPA: cytochrome c oxidase subunit 3 [Candidatus Acidoferrales bacterium]|nr:cytochrome c oxidase subunit 3 [Candidatus Acidoferrales bacterium]